MSKYNYNMLELDVDKLFEDHTIEEIQYIERCLDKEIEKKRNELRAMVGDRYRDVLAASDAITSMKDISEEIVTNIRNATEKCTEVLGWAPDNRNKFPFEKNLLETEELTVMIQMRLVMVIHNQIWIVLDAEDFSQATQLYLLAQYILTGLNLTRKELLDKLIILKRMKADIDALRSRILKRVKEKLQSIELTAEETCSNLNALMLLANQSSYDLLETFMELRKAALSMVINKPHFSVRVQITAMLHCLMSTVQLLQDCFINYQNTNASLISQQLDSIIGERAPKTLSKVVLPVTPLVEYIPDLIKEFRPKCFCTSITLSKDEIEERVKEWLQVTTDTITSELNTALGVVTNIRGLHSIREDALKVELPQNWKVICIETNLPHNFQIWHYFFQNIVTRRAKQLLTKKVLEISSDLQEEISNVFKEILSSERSENDLRWYTWHEETSDVSRTENKHTGLSMKTKGFSHNILRLCSKLDNSYSTLLKDLSLYLYGTRSEETADSGRIISENVLQERFVDTRELEEYLRNECCQNTYCLTTFLENCVKAETDGPAFVTKSLVSARFLHCLTSHCPNFTKCCSCNGHDDKWNKICSHFSECSMIFWQNWIEKCVTHTQEVARNSFTNKTALDMLHILPKWSRMEIQEQTDDSIFKSEIKLPSQPSLCLQTVLTEISNHMNNVIPHTLPKRIHLLYIERNLTVLFHHYDNLADTDLNQNQALQFLLDIKFVTTLCVPKENAKLVSSSQAICEKLRSRVDPFDLDVFYSHLQNNVKHCVLQSHVVLGCLLPNSGQLASLGQLEKGKEQDSEPSILAVSIPSSTSWFPLLPITAPVQKAVQTPTSQHKETKSNSPVKTKSTRKSNATGQVRAGAAALFGAMTNDWFS